MEERLEQRALKEHEASEAGLAVLNRQEKIIEPLDEKEAQWVIKINTEHFNESIFLDKFAELNKSG